MAAVAVAVAVATTVASAAGAVTAAVVVEVAGGALGGGDIDPKVVLQSLSCGSSADRVDVGTVVDGSSGGFLFDPPHP